MTACERVGRLSRYQVPAAVFLAQSAAIRQWVASGDPAGPKIDGLRVPTLVADGAIDQLDPVVNDKMPADAIAKAHLVVYPDAGHAFLFQDEATFVARLQQFFG